MSCCPFHFFPAFFFVMNHDQCAPLIIEYYSIFYIVDVKIVPSKIGFFLKIYVDFFTLILQFMIKTYEPQFDNLGNSSF